MCTSVHINKTNNDTIPRKPIEPYTPSPVRTYKSQNNYLVNLIFQGDGVYKTTCYVTIVHTNYT